MRRNELFLCGVWFVLILLPVNLIPAQTESSSRRSSDARGKTSQERTGDRPNIILINLDDADVGMFAKDIRKKYLPNIDRLASEGLSLTNCHVTTPLCGPSRTCLLRGQHAHRTGVKTNLPAGPMNAGFTGGYQAFKANGFGKEHLGGWMQRAGYRTMMIGKYLHGRVPGDELTEWDDRHICLGGSYFATVRYTTRRPPGQRRHMTRKEEYRTELEADEAVWMIQQQANRDRQRSDKASQPFFLYIAPLAPHLPAANGEMVQVKYRQLAKEIRLPETPDFNESDVSDKPVHLQMRKLDQETIEHLHGEHRKRILTLISVDDMIGRLFEALRENGYADNTYLFLTSDHGYQLGHNRMIAKKLPYHRCTVVPMFVYGPGVFRGASDHLLTHLDLAPTFLELAGGSATIELDGKSWVPLLSAPDSIPNDAFRDSLLIQNWEEKFLSLALPIPAGYASVRKPKQIYTEWANGQREFYDLNSDPFQLNNQYKNLTEDQKLKFAKELRQLKQGTPRPIATVSKGLISRNSTIHGKAEDDNGIKEVKVEIRELKNNLYWNGKTWTPDVAQVSSRLANPNGLLTDWHAQVDLSRIPDSDRIEVRAKSKDADDQISEIVSLVLQVDAVEPETLLKLPAKGTTVSSPVILFGTCSDNRKMFGIDLVLKRLDKDEYWDGVEWTRKRTTFLKRVAGERWHKELPLPPGRYYASAQARDAAGNVDSSISETEFNVK